MPAVLNTNAASLYASKNLQSAQSNMASSVERLSSGLRINRARDDAAGLGISNALTSQINSANQGIRNLNDGISLVQTAEGAINAANEMAQRIVTLATQGANGTMGSDERTSLKNEMKQLLNAIESIGARTKFSGVSLLNGDQQASATNKFVLQATNNTTDTVALDVTAFKNLGGGYSRSSMSSATAAGETTITLSTGVGVYSSANVGSVLYKKVTSTGVYSKIGTVTAVGSNQVTVSAVSAAITTADTLVFSGQMTGTFTSLSGTNDVSLIEAVDALADSSSTYQTVARVASGYVTALGTQRSLLGAYQNQIEFTVSNITELSSNLTAARSNVLDTDYASETASLTKGQILQQAATAMLAQANQMPNVILSLLK